jgi:hypothetical protein
VEKSNFRIVVVWNPDSALLVDNRRIKAEAILLAVMSAILIGGSRREGPGLDTRSGVGVHVLSSGVV